jgi:deoxyadenosine/deoxycytidine kinase
MYFVEGNIGSGKSTFLKKLSTEFKVVQEPVDEWSKMKNASSGKNILEEFYEDPKRNAYLFQSIAFRSRVKNITDIDADNVIVERSIYTDRMVFAEVCKEDGNINEIESNDYTEWFDFVVKHIGFKPKGFIYLRTDPEKSHERITKRNRSGESNISLEYLRKLHHRHDKWLCPESSRDATVPVLVLDVSEEFETNPEHLERMIQKVRDFVRA